MEYLLIFLEGIITFISPCILPMIPVYISYFAGQDNEKDNIKVIFNTLSFILGFTVTFTLLGALSSSLGIIVKSHMRIINVVLGAIVVIFGINFMGIINIPFINKTKGINFKKKTTLVSSFMFGIIFSLTWSPCIGTLLGTALGMVVLTGNILKGTILMIIYCMGLGIPFIISALIIDKLKTTFSFIKKHYNIINKICGIFLCIIGILMITGLIDKYFNLII